MEQINWPQVLASVLIAILGSTGLWSFIASIRNKHDAKTRLLIGLAHDRIIYLGASYIERGYITADEYENLHDYLYLPYAENGGNGSAKRIMEQVRALPIKNGLEVHYEQ